MDNPSEPGTCYSGGAWPGQVVVLSLALLPCCIIIYLLQMDNGSAREQRANAVWVANNFVELEEVDLLAVST